MHFYHVAEPAAFILLECLTAEDRCLYKLKSWQLEKYM